tara:strand:- start:199 stop:1107 length:909 start_codon:yes stop_codon:yes gene_type:complete
MKINKQLKMITIISVSYNSGEHLGRLFENLNEKAEHKQNLKYLVIDNTNGQDQQLKKNLPDNLDLTIIPNNGKGTQRSISHASGLDAGLKKSNTEYTLIIDPDVHVFRSNWDGSCMDYINDREKRLIGAPYPYWKLGKVHDYPSVVFMFFRTQEIKELNKSFHPFPSLIERTRNSFFRKINRLGFIANKSRLNKSSFLRLITSSLEKTFGITSPDTGKEIVEVIRQKGYESMNFKPYLQHQLHDITANESHHDIAKDFELYYLGDNPFMTHMYGSGVFHWKTKNSSNVKYWLKLIEDIEGAD